MSTEPFIANAWVEGSRHHFSLDSGDRGVDAIKAWCEENLEGNEWYTIHISRESRALFLSCDEVNAVKLKLTFPN